MLPDTNVRTRRLTASVLALLPLAWWLISCCQSRSVVSRPATFERIPDGQASSHVSGYVLAKAGSVAFQSAFDSLRHSHAAMRSMRPSLWSRAASW